MALLSNIVVFKIGWAPGLNVGRESTVVDENSRGFAKTLQAISGLAERSDSRCLPHTSQLLGELRPSSDFAITAGPSLTLTNSRSMQWPRGLRRGSAAAHLLRLWVRIPPRGHGYLSLVSIVCCAGRGLCDRLITRPEESYRLWRVVCSRTLANEEALAHWGAVAPKQNKKQNQYNNNNYPFQ
jgi:hypothetical protein